MKISYNWLQTYFKDKLPNPKELADVLTMGAFEVENVEQKNGDFILDIDILPNRAHDALSHRGIAKEVGVLLKLKTLENLLSSRTVTEGNSSRRRNSPESFGLDIQIKEPELCRRYIGRVIEGVKIGPSPQWLKERLESIGQKSINNIVDATNFVMFDIGQPLHAFDLDKIEGGKIIIRKARAGERITTLDEKEVVLNENNLVIADEKDALAIAGVKGGKKAEVDNNTTRIALEAANFNPISVRKTSRGLNILTDSSKRFENELTPELAGEAMKRVTLLISEMEGNEHAQAGENIDKYSRQPSPYKVGVSVEEVNNLLGTNLSENDIENILTRLGFSFEKVIDPIKKVLELAPQFVGVPYKYGASVSYDAPNYFDCSSFTSYLFARSGVQIPRMTVDQYFFGEEVEEQDLMPGDLIFSRNGDGKTVHYSSKEFLSGTNVPKGVDHNGMYLGDSKIIHASGKWHREEVVIENLKETPAFKNIRGYRRINATHPRFVVTAFAERLDIRIKEDLIEEIGRVYGYKNIPAKLPQVDFKPKINKNFYYADKIRQLLAGGGFSEIYNYTFAKKGEVELQNPLDKTKRFLRTNLSDGLFESLEKNKHNAPLLGLAEIKIFEIGKVFENDGEHFSLAIGVELAGNIKKANVFARKALEETLNKLSGGLGTEILDEIEGSVFEINLDELVRKLPEPTTTCLDSPSISKEIRYKEISPYPFVLRDIAVWTPEGTEEGAVVAVIVETAGGLLSRKPRLFDRFEKPARAGEADGPGKVSYAFNLVFQSYEKTLTDEEVNKIMDKIIKALEEKVEWEVRKQ